MKTNKSLQVRYGDKLVGTLAISENKMVAFQYDDNWIETGFSISPFSLPLKKDVFVPSNSNFDGLFGVFSDSLPDAWGKLLLDRLLKQRKIDQGKLNVLDRLAIVGDSGMGALSYRPEISMDHKSTDFDLDQLADQCTKVLAATYDDDLDELYKLGGTSGGARPKIMTNIDGEEWIIKFPSHVDMTEAGGMEYEYSLCAKKCGIDMTETKLFPSKTCRGYFGTKRFDRVAEPGGTLQKRLHMCTVAALLEIDHNQPNLDYSELMKLTKIITRDNHFDLEKMFRRMCFNVFAHNRDDHSKNFTFIFDEEDRQWRLSPAYDMTYSNTYFGEHTTSVNGNGKNPGMADVIEVGITAGMSKAKCSSIAAAVQNCVKTELAEYL